MVTIWASGFVFCMFLYLLADILDRLEIVSAQTIRTTRVLEDFEDKKEEKMQKKVSDIILKPLINVVAREGLEPPTFGL